MEAENPPTIVESRSCRSDKKLVAFIIEHGMRLIETIEPHVLFWINIKCKEYALWMFHKYEGQRMCNWLKHPLNLNKNNPENRFLERYNMLIAYGVPNSYELKLAYVQRAFIAYESEQDFYCIYNKWKANEIDVTINFIDESTKRDWDQMFERAFSRGLGNLHPFPYFDCEPLKCISSVVCKNCVKYGRYLHGKRNLMKGDLALRELPFIRLLLSGDRWMRCHHCLIYAPLVLIPCQTCSIMLYCSKSCHNSAYKEYHSLECPMMFKLFAEYTPIEVLALRLTIRVFKMCNEMPDRLNNYIRSVCMSDMSVYQYNTPNGCYNNPEGDYKKVYQLATNRRRLTRQQLTIDGLRGVALAKMFVNKHRLPTSFMELLAELTVRHIHILRVNVLVLHCSVDDPAKDCFDAESVPYALALVTTGSMFNHSCNANVDFSLDTDGTIVFNANRDIPFREQMHINYRRNPADERYPFECYCLKCRLCAGHSSCDVP